MATQRSVIFPVLIIGAGRGGQALLEMFMEDTLVKVIAMADSDPDAPGLMLAKKLGIPTYTDADEALLAGSQYADCIVYNLSHDDSIAAKAENIFGDKRVASGQEVKLFWQMVTNLKKTREELVKSQHMLKSVIHNVMDAIITTNELGDILGFNPAAENIFGYTQQEIIGKNIKILMPEPVRSVHDSYIRHYLETGQSKLLGVPCREVMAARKNGESFLMEMSVSEMMLGKQRYFVGITRDITERKLAENKIAHMAHHDYLTGLPNRAKFMDNLEYSMRHAKRNIYKIATLFLDLDGFKKVNDLQGHGTGDQLLKEVAKRLVKTVRSSDTVARIGGDEFILVLSDIKLDENVSAVAGKIIASLAQPFDLNGHVLNVSGSIGISIYPDDSENIETLVKQADEAMYLAKHSGKNAFKFYKEAHKIDQARSAAGSQA